MMGGQTLHGDAILGLRDEVAAGPATAAKAGTASVVDIMTPYLARVIGDIKLSRPMKIAIDCGNGVAGAVAPALFRGLGCEVTELFCTVDGTFPNHHPDPADPHNLEDLIRCVQTTDCEIGLAFDGDGDRLGVVTKSGQIIWPDRQLILYARDVLQRCPGETIIYDVKCSRHVAEQVRAAGGKPLMWQTGHSLIKAKLAETGAPLAGEMSGHVFFKERWFGFDDGLYTGARLLEILSRDTNPSAVLEALPQGVSTPELKLEMREGEPHALIKRLQTEGVFAGATEIFKIDGLRADYADGFGLARAPTLHLSSCCASRVIPPKLLSASKAYFESNYWRSPRMPSCRFNCSTPPFFFAEPYAFTVEQSRLETVFSSRTEQSLQA